MKKLFLTGLLACGLTMMFTGCGSSGNHVDFLPAKVDKGDKWGLVNSGGEMLLNDEFDERPSCVVNGYFYVEEAKGITVYKADNHIKAVNNLEELKDAGYMSEGIMPVVSKGERIRYVDGEGVTKFVLNPVGGAEIIRVMSYFCEGKAAFATSDNKSGYIDTKGNVVIAAKWDVCSFFHDGCALAAKDDRYYVIDDKGNEIFKLKEGYTIESSCVKDGKILVTDEKGRISLVDIKTDEYKKLPEKVRGVRNFNKKYILFSDETGKFGVMDMEGETLIRAKYRSICFASEKTFLALSENKKAAIIDAEGEEVASIGEASYIENIGDYLMDNYGMSSDFQLSVEEENDIKFYDKGGKPIINKSFSNVKARIENTVTSDYFDAEGAVAKFVSYFSNNGFGGISMGSNPRSFLSGTAESHRGEDSYSIPDLEGGFRYSISGKAYDIDRYFVTTETVLNGYWYNTNYVWNANSSIDKITAYLFTGPNGTFDKIRDEFIRQIGEKGWHLDNNNTAYATFSQGNNKMLLVPYGSLGDGITVYIYTNEFWGNNYRNLENEAIRNFSSFSEDTAVPVEEEEDVAVEYVEVADTVA